MPSPLSLQMQGEMQVSENAQAGHSLLIQSLASFTSAFRTG